MTDFITLFARDPLKHTDADVDLIIAKFREMRVNFNSGVKPVAAPKLTAKEKTVSGLGLKLDLGDLT